MSRLRLGVWGVAMVGALLAAWFGVQVWQRASTIAPGADLRGSAASAPSEPGGLSARGHVGSSAQSVAILHTGNLLTGSEPVRGNRFLIAATDESANWRALAIDALKSPASGGAFAAWVLATECTKDYGTMSRIAAAETRRSVDAAGTVSQSRLRAVELLQSRCAQFALGEAAEIVKRVETERQLRTEDPLLAARLGYKSSMLTKSPQAKQEAYSRLIETRTLSVLDADLSLDQLMAFAGRSKGFAAMYFDGEFYTEEDGSRFNQLVLAIRIAPCLGPELCALDSQQLINCAVNGRQCGESRSDLIEQIVLDEGLPISGPRSPIELGHRIRDAIVSGETAAFFPQ